LAHLSQTNQALVAQLEAAETLIKQLKQENALLKSRLGIA
jgi:cell shape-determining protein MreC